MTILLYCRRKNWELLGVSVTCILDEIDGSVLAKNEEAQSSIGNISVSIKLDSNLDEYQISRIEDISSRCPVHKILAHSYEISHNIET
tara:strand:- start:663 stop:926 length:264 start_codon:yes stop_codon:yes gene_type:complete